MHCVIVSNGPKIKPQLRYLQETLERIENIVVEVSNGMELDGY
jgi:hypothetical protein